MADDEEPFRYISYATMREAWGELRVAFVVWLVLSAVSLAVGGLMQAGASATESIWSAVPRPLLYVFGFAVFSWFVRGGEFKLVFPRSFKLWLLTNIVVALIALGAVYAPTWAMIPIYLGAMLVVSSLDSLARIGKANYERLATSNVGTDHDEA